MVPVEPALKKAKSVLASARRMTSLVTCIYKQIIPLIPSKCKVIEYTTLLFPKALTRSL